MTTDTKPCRWHFDACACRQARARTVERRGRVMLAQARRSRRWQRLDERAASELGAAWWRASDEREVIVCALSRALVDLDAAERWEREIDHEARAYLNTLVDSNSALIEAKSERDRLRVDLDRQRDQVGRLVALLGLPPKQARDLVDSYTTHWEVVRGERDRLRVALTAYMHPAGDTPEELYAQGKAALHQEGSPNDAG